MSGSLIQEGERYMNTGYGPMIDLDDLIFEEDAGGPSER